MINRSIFTDYRSRPTLAVALTAMSISEVQHGRPDDTVERISFGPQIIAFLHVFPRPKVPIDAHRTQLVRPVKSYVSQSHKSFRI